MNFFHLHLHLSTAILLASHMVAATNDVIIIGAGAAGMSAAKTLLERNASLAITILEATDRIGGRVRTIQLGDTRVEMGAEEHYGAKGGNPVYEAVTARYGTNIYVDGDLRTGPVTGSIVYAMPPLAGSSDLGTCGTITYGTGIKNCADDQAWKTYIGLWDWYWKPSTFQKNKTQTYEWSLSQSSKFFSGVSNYRATRGWFAYNSAFGSEFGTTVDKMGAHDTALMDFEWPLSDDVFLNTNNLGYSDVLNEIWWKDTVDKVTLKLNSPVTQVNTPLNSDGQVEVVVTSGGKLSAKYVIVTASIGVLKESIKAGSNEGIRFNPALPLNTTKAITDIGFDQGMKVALKFNSAPDGCNVTGNPWWHTAVGGKVNWLVTRGMSGGWMWPANYKNGSYDHVFNTFIMGDNAKQLSGLTNNDIVKKILGDLDSMFIDKPASKCFGAISPDKYIVQNWGRSPYTRGAYSYSTPTTISNTGTAYAGNARELLRAPVLGRIYFAGEGTSFTMGGTVPGAVFEGQRVGNALPVSKAFPRRNALDATGMSNKKREANLRGSFDAEGRIMSSGKNGVVDYRGKHMLDMAKAGKSA